MNLMEGVKKVGMSLKGWLSTIGLVGLIVFDAILIAIVGFSHQWWWMWFFICITVLVGVFETTSYILTGKTISQHWWDWSKTSKKAAWWSLAAAGAFLIAMNMLVLHLISLLVANLFGA